MLCALLALNSEYDIAPTNHFYGPEGTSGGILKSHRPSVRLSVRPLQIVSQRKLINYGSKFDETSQKDKA